MAWKESVTISNENQFTSFYMSGSWRRYGVFIVNFENISHIVLVFFIVDFEQLNASWEKGNLQFILCCLGMNMFIQIGWRKI